MNRVEQVGEALEEAAFPQKAIFFAGHLLLLAEENIAVYRLVDEQLQSLPGLRLDFPLPLLHVSFTHICVADEHRLLLLNRTQKPLGLVLHTLTAELRLLPAASVAYDDLRDFASYGHKQVLLRDPDSLALCNLDGTLSVLRRADGWRRPHPLRLPCRERIAHFQHGTAVAVHCVERATPAYHVVDLFAEKDLAAYRAPTGYERPFKVVFADANLLVLLHRDCTFVHGASLGEWLQLPPGGYALGAARVPGGSRYALWGDALHLFDAQTGEFGATLSCEAEIVHCFPLGEAAFIAVTFHAVELLAPGKRVRLLAFAPALLRLA